VLSQWDLPVTTGIITCFASHFYPIAVHYVSLWNIKIIILFRYETLLADIFFILNSLRISASTSGLPPSGFPNNRVVFASGTDDSTPPPTEHE